jgi:N-carbamoyl-L-amino-acid hydrolase
MTMNRRSFHRRVIGLAGGFFLPGRAASRLEIDGGRLSRTLLELAAFGKNREGGVSRVAFSEADRSARAYARELMREAGLEPQIDFAANLIGRRAGSEPGLPPILLGSHIDSVPEGGNYDGQVGSMGAIEVVRTLSDEGRTTRHPLEVILFTNEEGGKTGSRALGGELTEAELDFTTASGRTIQEGVSFLGGDPARWREVRRKPGDAACYLELHVEQGGVLDQRGIAIGVVEGIVGIKRWKVTVEGFQNHAGTTPMDQRRDALVAAARWVDAVNRVARGTAGRQVATVGRIQAFPGAPNVIPGRVETSLEIRDLDMGKIDSVYRSIEQEGIRIGEETGTRFGWEEIYVSRAALTDPRLQQAVADAAYALGLSTLRMPSGAGHDAQSIALFAPIGMIFVPSVEGISHSPKEFSRPEDIAAGANVLLNALLAVDAAF